jgi:hypothetical protein
LGEHAEALHHEDTPPIELAKTCARLRQYCHGIVVVAILGFS